LLEIENREELDEQQFNWLILCHRFLTLINQWSYILNNNHVAFLSSACLFFYHKPPYTLYAWIWPRPMRKKNARYVASQGVSFKKIVLTLNTKKLWLESWHYGASFGEGRLLNKVEFDFLHHLEYFDFGPLMGSGGPNL
jgi:hypothetical protein